MRKAVVHKAVVDCLNHFSLVLIVFEMPLLIYHYRWRNSAMMQPTRSNEVENVYAWTSRPWYDSKTFRANELLKPCNLSTSFFPISISNFLPCLLWTRMLLPSLTDTDILLTFLFLEKVCILAEYRNVFPNLYSFFCKYEVWTWA